MPPSVVRLEQAQRESIVIGRRSANVGARIRRHDMDLALPRTQNALAPRRGSGRSRRNSESNNGE